MNICFFKVYGNPAVINLPLWYESCIRPCPRVTNFPLSYHGSRVYPVSRRQICPHTNILL